MIGPHFFACLLGLCILFGGGELLLRGSCALSKKKNLPESLLGLVVVLTTLAPALLLGMDASFKQSPQLALGMVMGGVVCAMALGGAYMLWAAPFTARQSVQRDGTIMIGSALLVWLLASDHWISANDGLLLIAASLAYANDLLKRNVTDLAQGARARNVRCGWCAAGYVAMGLALLVTGADIILGAAPKLVEIWGVTEVKLGIYLLAAGAFAPAMIATLRQIRTLGNPTGTQLLLACNIFALLGILGTCASFNPIRTQGWPLEHGFWLMLVALGAGFGFMHKRSA